jgi:cytochrome c oxidase cbb3-type subunit III
MEPFEAFPKFGCRSAACSLVSALLVAAFFFCGEKTGAQTSRQPLGAGTAQQQSANKARQIFESTCAACHGLDGRGGERAPDIATRPQVVQLSDAELQEVLRGGRPATGMPSFASLGANTIKALVAYVRFLQGKDAATILPGDAANGKRIFFGKGRCADCHMIQGQGGFLGRDLSDYGTTLSAGEIRRYILKPAESTTGGKRLTTVRLHDSAQIAGVIRNEDNFSVQLQTLDGTFHFFAKSDIAAMETAPEPIMPTNYGSVLSAAELDDLVKYLRTVANPQDNQPKRDSDDDE